MSNVIYQAIINRIAKEDGKAIKEMVLIQDLLFTQNLDLNANEVIDGKQVLSVSKQLTYEPNNSKYYLANFDEFFSQNEEANLILNDFVSIEEDNEGNLRFLIACFGKERGDEYFKTLYQYEKNDIHAPITNKQLNIINPILDILKNIEPKRIETIQQLESQNNVSQEDFSLLNVLINELSQDLFSLLEQSIDEKLQIETLEASIDQIMPESSIKNLQHLEKGNLALITAKEFRTPFIKDFSEEMLKSGEITFNVTVGKKEDGTPIKVPVTLKLRKNLRYYQYLIASSYFSLLQSNPTANGIPILDIVNQIHKSRNGSRIESKSKIYQEAYSYAEDLIGVTFTLDRSEVVKYEAKQGNKRAIRYLASGGTGKVTDTFISAFLGTVPAPNGKPVDALIPKTGFLNNDLYNLILEVNQIKVIPEEISTTPLNASIQNDEIFRYIGGRIANMPYYSKTKFLDKKKEILKTLEEAKQDLEEERSKKEIELNKNIEDLTKEINKTKKLINSKTATFKSQQTQDLKKQLQELQEKLKSTKTELRQLKKITSSKLKDLEKELTTPLKNVQKELLKNQRSRNSIRINLETMIEEVKIKNPRRKRLTEYMEEIFNLWIADNILVGFKKFERKSKGNNNISYEIYFF